MKSALSRAALILLGLGGLFTAPPALAVEVLEDALDSPIAWGYWEPRGWGGFRFQSVQMQQRGGNQLTSLAMSWNPTWTLSDDFALVGSVGAMPLKLSTASGTVMGVQWGVLASWLAGGQFSVEAGVGGQSWGKYSRVGFDYTLNLRIALTGGVLRALILSGGYFDRPTASFFGAASPVARAGLGLELQVF